MNKCAPGLSRLVCPWMAAWTSQAHIYCIFISHFKNMIFLRSLAAFSLNSWGNSMFFKCSSWGRKVKKVSFCVFLQKNRFHMKVGEKKSYFFTKLKNKLTYVEQQIMEKNVLNEIQKSWREYIKKCSSTDFQDGLKSSRGAFHENLSFHPHLRSAKTISPLP